MKKNKLYPNYWKASDNSKISCKEKMYFDKKNKNSVWNPD